MGNNLEYYTNLIETICSKKAKPHPTQLGSVLNQIVQELSLTPEDKLYLLGFITNKTNLCSCLFGFGSKQSQLSLLAFLQTLKNQDFDANAIFNLLKLSPNGFLTIGHLIFLHSAQPDPDIFKEYFSLINSLINTNTTENALDLCESLLTQPEIALGRHLLYRSEDALVLYFGLFKKILKEGGNASRVFDLLLLELDGLLASQEQAASAYFELIAMLAENKDFTSNSLEFLKWFAVKVPAIAKIPLPFLTKEIFYSYLNLVQRALSDKNIEAHEEAISILSNLLNYPAPWNKITMRSYLDLLNRFAKNNLHSKALDLIFHDYVRCLRQSALFYSANADDPEFIRDFLELIYQAHKNEPRLQAKIELLFNLTPSSQPNLNLAESIQWWSKIPSGLTLFFLRNYQFPQKAYDSIIHSKSQLRDYIFLLPLSEQKAVLKECLENDKALGKLFLKKDFLGFYNIRSKEILSSLQERYYNLTGERIVIKGPWQRFIDKVKSVLTHWGLLASSQSNLKKQSSYSMLSKNLAATTTRNPSTSPAEPEMKNDSDAVQSTADTMASSEAALVSKQTFYAPKARVSNLTVPSTSLSASPSRAF